MSVYICCSHLSSTVCPLSANFSPASKHTECTEVDADNNSLNNYSPISSQKLGRNLEWDMAFTQVVSYLFTPEKCVICNMQRCKKTVCSTVWSKFSISTCTLCLVSGARVRILQLQFLVLPLSKQRDVVERGVRGRWLWLVAITGWGAGLGEWDDKWYPLWWQFI